MNKLIEKANILAEALPYIHKLAKKTVVIKYGGNAMNINENTVLQDVAMLKIVGVNPILVHGGGPEINHYLKKLDIESSFHGGLRVTSKDAIEVVQMVLCGKLNKDITAKMNTLGVKALGICGKDANLIEVEKMNASDGFDLGYVGSVKKINTKLLELLINDEFVPVIATVGTDSEGNSYNINADTAAAEIAVALRAEKLIYLTDTDGVFADKNDKSTLLHFAAIADLKKMVAEGTIDGGMIPKVNACIQGVENGINCVHIINGSIPHPVMLEIFTDSGIGTMITK